MAVVPDIIIFVELPRTLQEVDLAAFSNVWSFLSWSRVFLPPHNIVGGASSVIVIIGVGG